MTGQKNASRPQSLIATKFIAAEFSPRFVSRSALFAPMFQRRSGGAVLSIVATAGSGKSTVMAEFHKILADQGVKTCWLSLDSDDDNPASFAAYLVGALQVVDRSLAPNAMALIRSNQVLGFDELFDQLVRQISNSPIELAIFLDDFQHIKNPTLISFLNRLVSHLPSGVCFVISSRSHLPLNLGQLRLRSLLIEIDQVELNFDRPMTAQLLKRVHDLDLSPSDLAAFVDMTEGWATAIQLAALALHRYGGPARKLIDSFSGHEHSLTSYLLESVLDSQPKEVRDFLLTTSPLRRMSKHLCEAVSGQHNCEEMLKHLEQRHLFLIPLDRLGYWYRYHHLFADFLQNEFRRVSLEHYQTVCERAARWCEGNGHTTEAIQYSLDCGQFEKASNLIAEHALTVAQRSGDHYTVLDWMRRLPLAYHESHPEILLSHAWSMAFSQNSHEAMELTNRVLAKLRVGGSASWVLADGARVRLGLIALVTQAVAEATADQLDACLTHALDLRAKLPQNEMFLIAAIGNCMSYCYFAQREFVKSAIAADEAYVFGQRSNSDFATAWADFLHGLANLELGKLGDAREHSRRMLECALRGGVAQSYVAGLAFLLDAEIAVQSCDFDLLKKHAEDGSFFSEVFGPVEPLLLSIRSQARLLAHWNRVVEARRVLTDGQDLALKLNLPRLFVTLVIEEAELLLSSGDVDGALKSVQRTHVLDNKINRLELGNFAGSDDVLRLFEVRLLIANGDASAALRKLGPLQHRHNSERATSISLTVVALKSIALWRCDRHAEAARELDHALTQAAREFHVYPLYRVGADLVPILLAIGKRRSVQAPTGNLEAKDKLESHLLRLLAAETHSGESIRPDAVESSRPAEPLTDRETELLRLVDAGLSNRQLSNELLITEATAKWHLHNIYTKMGVRSRSAAAARARALKLL